MQHFHSTFRLGQTQGKRHFQKALLWQRPWNIMREKKKISVHFIKQKKQRVCWIISAKINPKTKQSPDTSWSASVKRTSLPFLLLFYNQKSKQLTKTSLTTFSAPASMPHCLEWGERRNDTIQEVSFLLADSAPARYRIDFNCITRLHLTLYAITSSSRGQQSPGASWAGAIQGNYLSDRVTGFSDMTSQTIHLSPENESRLLLGHINLRAGRV